MRRRLCVVCLLVLSIVTGSGCPTVRRVANTAPRTDSTWSINQQRIAEEAGLLTARAATAFADTTDGSTQRAIQHWIRAYELYRVNGSTEAAQAVSEAIVAAYRHQGDTTAMRQWERTTSRSAIPPNTYMLEARNERVHSGLVSSMTHGDVSTGVYAGSEQNLILEFQEYARARARQRLSEAEAMANRGQQDSALAVYGSTLLYEERDLKDQARQLLSSNPFLDAATDSSATAQFFEAASAVLAELPKRVLTKPPTNASEAMSYLEALFADERVSAIVTSAPSGLDVTYWPIARDSGSAHSVTTADTLRIRPATYIFRVRDVQSGQIRSVKRDCLNGCRVHLTVPQP
jgi:hypothetical protein